MNSMDRDRDRKSLQELAKLGAMTPSPAAIRPVPTPSGSDVMLPASRLEDSGLVDFGAFSAAPAPVAPIAASHAPVPTTLSPVHPMQPSPMTVPLQAVAPSLSPASYAPPPPSAHPHSLAPQSANAMVTGTLPLAALNAHQAAAITNSAPPSLASQVTPSTNTKKSGRGALIAITAIVGLAAAAGGVFTLGKVRPGLIPGLGTKPIPVAVTPAAPAAVAADGPVMTQNLTAPVAPAPQPVAAAEKPADGSIDPMSLPVAGQKTAPAPAAAAPHAGGTHAAAPVAAAPAKTEKVAAAEKPAAPEKAAAAEKPEQKDNSKAALFAGQGDTAPAAKKELQPPTGDGTALGEAMRQAAGPAVSQTDRPDEPKKKAPDYAPGSVPQRPSQGAVSGALGNVLPNARACLGPDDPVSKATVVFASGGTVQSISIHGAAAGKPAEQCIKAALNHAKLPPFAESTYTANITIRH